MVVVALVGLPGSGKSTVGKALRDNHGWFYVDSDEEIEKKTSRTTANIIREDGEEAFRAIESEVIDQLICTLLNKSERWSVLSLGGGAVTTKAVLDLLLSKTIMINLEVSHTEQLKRIESELSNKRPLIAGKTPTEIESKLKALRLQRGELYNKSKYKILTDNKTATTIAAEIINLVK